MLLGQVFERFVGKTPFAVMSRSLLERTLTPETLDALFEEKADRQYTRELTFSSVVDLLGQVVTAAFPSVRAAFLDKSFDISVALTSLYHKLQGIEAEVSAELVRHTARQLQPLIQEFSTRGAVRVLRGRDGVQPAKRDHGSDAFGAWGRESRERPFALLRKWPVRLGKCTEA